MTWREARDLLDGKGKRRPPRDRLKIARNTWLERGEAFQPASSRTGSGMPPWAGTYMAMRFRDFYPDNAIGVRFHETYVAILTPHWTELYTGGWTTVATRDRMQYGLARGVWISSDRSGWIVILRDETWSDGGHPYFEGMRVSADGTRLLVTQPHKPRTFRPLKTVSGYDLGSRPVPAVYGGSWR